MQITFLDADTREVVERVDRPNSAAYMADVLAFVRNLGAEIVRIRPQPGPDAWIVELKMPAAVLREHTPLPGEASAPQGRGEGAGA